MTKDVTVAELEHDLAGRLEEVRTGTTLQVVVNGKPIARIEPAGAVELPVQPNNEPFGPPRMKWDPVESRLVERGQIREPITFADPSLGPLGEWTPPSLHLDWDPVDDLIAERNRYR